MGYKLLSQDMKTRKGETNEMDWSDVGTWHKATGVQNQPLCTDGWLHDYDDVLLAVLMNPIHAGIDNPICYSTKRKGKTKSDGLKRGSRQLCLVTKVELPKVTIQQRVCFAILCAKAVFTSNNKWTQWANAWLINKDRSQAAADAAAAAADAAACAAAAYAADAAAYAADAYAADAAAYADARAAARAVAYTATNVADAYAAVGLNNRKLNFVNLAKQAMIIGD